MCVHVNQNSSPHCLPDASTNQGSLVRLAQPRGIKIGKVCIECVQKCHYTSDSVACSSIAIDCFMRLLFLTLSFSSFLFWNFVLHWSKLKLSFETNKSWKEENKGKYVFMWWNHSALHQTLGKQSSKHK